MLPRMEAWEQIEGAQAFVDWFGRWPSFHDAEVVHLHLNTQGPSSLLIYTSEMLTETDEKGYFKSAKHVNVEFLLFELEKVEIEGEEFCVGNILMFMACTKEGECLTLDWHSLLGIGALLSARQVTLNFTPLDGPLR
jgi:hypothetical protein